MWPTGRPRRHQERARRNGLRIKSLEGDPPSPAILQAPPPPTRRPIAPQSCLKHGHTQAANRHVLDCKKLLAPPSQYPVVRFSVQVVYNRVLLGSHLYNSYHKKRLAAVQNVSAREHVLMLQNCASECVNDRTYRFLRDSCNQGALCSLGHGSGALDSLRIQALPTNHEKTKTCCCTCSCYSRTPKNPALQLLQKSSQVGLCGVVVSGALRSEREGAVLRPASPKRNCSRVATKTGSAAEFMSSDLPTQRRHVTPARATGRLALCPSSLSPRAPRAGPRTAGGLQADRPRVAPISRCAATTCHADTPCLNTATGAQSRESAATGPRAASVTDRKRSKYRVRKKSSFSKHTTVSTGRQ